MQNKVYFIFGIHNHQPVGNFENVLETGYNISYRPFVETIAKHKKIKWCLHTSGILWDYFEKKHPEYIETVKQMVDDGRVEMLTGGYYEPILPSIPDIDKKGQIELMTGFLKNKFNTKSKGLWLTERVWEPHMAKVLNEAGVEYIVVDDAHFAASGMNPETLNGYYVTEEQGVKLKIFPISQKLRYSIPFQSVAKNMEYFSHLHKTMQNPIVVMADDGEKFGMWPETYKHVYEDGWLEHFITELENNSDWIETITFSEYIAKFGPRGRVYLPTASYFEMSEWSLPVDAQEVFEHVVKDFESQERVKRFLKGGFWRNFLTKYSESNNMHKKMLHVSQKIEQYSDKKNIKKKNIVSTLNNRLYQGQCNCAYWHGVFGGLYLPHLRTAIYRELIEAEAMMAGGIKKPVWSQIDLDKDGYNEYLFESKDQNIYISPNKGGSIFEWDILSKNLNMLNVLTRRKEAYHSRLRDYLSKKHSGGSDGQSKTIHDIVKVKEANLDKYLNYDWYNRVSLLDHFLHPETTFEGFKFSQYGEQGDFVLGQYDVNVQQENITLKRKGSVWVNGQQKNIEISKTVKPIASSIEIEYEIKNCDNERFEIIFAPEFSFAFSNPHEDENIILKDIVSWNRKDEGFGLVLKMEFSEIVELWTMPIETVSLSEGGFERTYQGTVVLPKMKIDLKKDKSHNIKIKVSVE